MFKKSYPYLLVFVQFCCIGFFIIYCGPVAKHWFGLVTQCSAVLLGIISIIIMQPGNFSVFPRPAQYAQLITKGPYRLIRHPMYTSVLLFCASLLSNRIGVLSLAAFSILVTDLVLKLYYEEALLKNYFTGYRNYMKNTWRLLPFIY